MMFRVSSAYEVPQKHAFDFTPGRWAGKWTTGRPELLAAKTGPAVATPVIASSVPAAATVAPIRS